MMDLPAEKKWQIYCSRKKVRSLFIFVIVDAICKGALYSVVL